MNLISISFEIQIYPGSVWSWSVYLFDHLADSPFSLHSGYFFINKQALIQFLCFFCRSLVSQSKATLMHLVIWICKSSCGGDGYKFVKSFALTLKPCKLKYFCWANLFISFKCSIKSSVSFKIELSFNVIPVLIINMLEYILRRVVITSLSAIETTFDNGVLAKCEPPTMNRAQCFFLCFFTLKYMCPSLLGLSLHSPFLSSVYLSTIPFSTQNWLHMFT